MRFAGSKRKAKNAPTEKDVQESGGSNCYVQNLSIAYIFSCLNCRLKSTYIGQANKIVSYLSSKAE